MCNFCGGFGGVQFHIPGFRAKPWWQLRSRASPPDFHPNPTPDGAAVLAAPRRECQRPRNIHSRRPGPGHPGDPEAQAAGPAVSVSSPMWQGFTRTTWRLVHTGTQGDSYLFMDLGFTYEQKLTDEWTIESHDPPGIFPLRPFQLVEFRGFQPRRRLSPTSAKSCGTSRFFGRYNFERFTKGDLGEDFFRNNSITIGMQKTFIFNQYQYAYFGYSSVFGWAVTRFRRAATSTGFRRNPLQFHPEVLRRSFTIARRCLITASAGLI